MDETAVASKKMEVRGKMKVKSLKRFFSLEKFIYVLSAYFLLPSSYDIDSCPSAALCRRNPCRIRCFVQGCSSGRRGGSNGQGDGAGFRVGTRRCQGWHLVSGPIPAVIGRNGLAPIGEKREGDGRTPSGTFELRRAFGYEKGVPTGLDYRGVTEKDFWIDAPASPFYNQWVAGDIPEVSHEMLRRQDDLYKYAIVIEYNTGPVIPGMGSAIFMHVWRAANKPTAGCVAMAEIDLLRLLQWLDAHRNPVILLKGSP